MPKQSSWLRIKTSLKSRGGFIFLLAAFSCAAADWPQYRGAGHDGISADRITKEWTGTVTNPLWRVSLPNGLGSFAVSGGRVFTKIRRDVNGADKELCVALNPVNGQELWATPVDNPSYPQGGVGFDDGPRSTPSVVGDSVFVLSSYLKLYRLNATNGAVVWQKDLLALYEGTVIDWQNAASPLIEDGLIFVNANSQTNLGENLIRTNTILALRTSDGSPAWRSQTEAMTHSTPVLATIHGVRQVIFATQSGLLSLDPQSGNRLWRFNYPFNYATSLAPSPVVHEDIVFICGARLYNMYSVAMRATLANGTWTTTQLWSSTSLAAHWMTPVCHEGFLYGMFGVFQFDGEQAQLKCVDIQTGVQQWSVNDFGRGGIALVDNHLVVVTEKMELVLAKPDPNAYTELGRFLAIPDHHALSNKCWNSPAIADGRVYVRSTAHGAAFDLSVPPLPELKMDSPLPLPGGLIRLTVRTADGSPVDSNRLATFSVRATTNLNVPPSSWGVLTNGPVLINGTVRLENVDTSAHPQRFFIVSEPE